MFLTLSNDKECWYSEGDRGRSERLINNPIIGFLSSQG